jgi:hypothetical protein
MVTKRARDGNHRKDRAGLQNLGTGAGAAAPGLIFGCREQFFARHLL